VAIVENEEEEQEDGIDELLPLGAPTAVTKMPQCPDKTARGVAIMAGNEE
jgi:hypothetical protein